MSHHHIEVMILTQQLFEIIIDCICATNSRTVSIGKYYCRMILIGRGWYIFDIISCHPIKTIVLVAVIVVTNFGFGFEVLELHR